MYDFSKLKYFVENTLGINTRNAKSNFVMIKERLTYKGLQENIHIDDTGIYYKDSDGKKHKGFLYIEIFNPVEWREKGWNDVPTFHIANCNVIQRQKSKSNFNGHYVFSNQPVTDVLDADGNKHDLPLCSNCYKLVQQIPRGINSTIYIEKYLMPTLTDDDIPLPTIDINTDMFGYTPDWEERSKEYRTKHNFTCEICGLKLNDIFVHGFYLETHHSNGNKEDNNENNLKCLCTLCHAFVNETHIRNYQRQINKKKLTEFLDLFKDKLEENKNPYLNRLVELNL